MSLPIGRAPMLASTPDPPSAGNKKLQANRQNLARKRKGSPRGAGAPEAGGPLLAVLDLGTNNCRLLIAHPAAGDSFRVVDSFSRIVRLGEGVTATGLLSDAALDRTIAALKVCAQRIAKHGVVHVRAVATQAARLAANREVLVARARAEAGIELTVISAQQEADLAALGCAPLIGRKYRGALIFDIGGGSTEIIRLRRPGGNGQSSKGGGFETLLSASLPFGVVTLSEEYGPAAQSRAGFEAMRAAMQPRFAALAGEGGTPFDPKAEHLLGTSGTVTTLAAIALKLPRYNRTRVDASWYETPRMLAVVERVSHLSVPGLAKLGPVGPERADLMLAGSAIFAAICAVWPSTTLRVADRGLREGMLRQMRQELQSGMVAS
jgi:exopolyphosphatase/guanosine-5'-triphosphate,3'-diphosphate pyrophosphatase